MRENLSYLWNSGPGGKFSVLIGFSTIALIPLLACLLCTLLILPSSPEVSEIPTEAPVAPVITEETQEEQAALPTPTEEEPPTETPTIAPTPTEFLEFPLIPGLELVDVTLNLEQRDLATCDSPHEFNNRYTTFCSDDSVNVVYSLLVDISGPDINRVDYISATVIQLVDQPTDEFPKLLLGFIATMPYDGADPEAARAWVEATLPTLGDDGSVETTIGDVKFRLYGNPLNRSLDMEGVAPQ
jgi:hypothetical protein